MHLEDGGKAALLATVLEARGPRLVLDRSIFYGGTGAYRHPAPADRGHLVVAGHKLKLVSVRETREGRLVHEVRGPPPPAGARAQLHLDVERRREAMRAHAAAHLVAGALAARGVGFAAPVEVVGGGQAKLVLDVAPGAAPKLLAEAVSEARAAVAAKARIVTRWATREEARRAETPSPTPVGDLPAGVDPVRLVAIGERCVVACDGPHLAHAGDVGDVAVADVRPRENGVRAMLKVARC